MKPQRVLMLHNHYGSSAPSGENRVFELERELLSARGHEVYTIERYSDEIRSKRVIGLAIGGLSTVWNPRSVRRVREAVRRLEPDIVHAHNTFPLLSPGVFSAAEGVPRVLTLHNYRLYCTAGIPMRDGAPCTECLDRGSSFPALRYGCYRSSRVASVPLAASVELHRRRGTWERDVEAYIALTPFQRDAMVDAGLPSRRVWVKPNFFPGSPEVTPLCERRGYVVFAGRVSEEKGVADLVEAWRRWGPDAPDLRIVGDGPLREELAGAVDSHPRVHFLGQVSAEEAQGEIAGADLLVLPSRWFEGFPMVLREAFAFGTPSLVSNIGPLPGLVAKGAGTTFAVGCPRHLLETARSLLHRRDMLERMSGQARREFESRYTEDANYKTLMRVYDEAKGELTRRDAR